MNLNLRIIIKIIGALIVLLGLAMVPAFIVSIIYRELSIAILFVKIVVPMILIGILIFKKMKVKSRRLKLREGFLIVTMTWLIASLFGTLPYLLSGTFTSFIDAFFESVSGFTTTGATIITDVESLPKGIVFWRSFSQWLGGMGILVFAISFLPALGISGQFMIKAETPGPTLDKISPRISDSAKLLYLMYSFFTIIAIILFKLKGLSLFDSIILSFGSVSSGGLSNYNNGISYFSSLYVELIIALFAVLACLNFTLYYTAIRRKWKDFFGNHELRAFFGILAGSFLLIFLNLLQNNCYDSAADCLRYSFFHSTSFITTTGLYSTSYDIWPSFSKMMLMILMIIGACSSSTGGGIKIVRVLILFKLIRRSLYKKLHPRLILPIKLQGKNITSDNMTGIMSFLYMYIFIFILSIFILSFENLDLFTTVAAVSSTLNNVGTGFGMVGPEGSFAMFSDLSKIYISLLMIMGRLELLTVLLLLLPSFWNPDR